MSLESVLLEFGAVEVSAMALYSDVFRLGSGFIQGVGEEPGYHKANPIILGSFNGEMRRRILFEDTFEETLAEFQQADWAIANGLTYWGKANTAEAQSKMCALVFDLDGQDPGGKCLENLLAGTVNWPIQAYPQPQYVALSGSNVHLYYVLEEPLSLYPNVKTQLKDLKYRLTDLLWNKYTSKDKYPQHQGINQGFRVIGGRTKGGVAVRAFRLNAHPTTVEELNGFVEPEHRVDLSARWCATTSLDQARAKWPGWYARVVEGGAPAGRHAWPVKEDLYLWWLRKVPEQAVPGHRYFCIMTLAVFAAKCGITDHEQVKADAMALLPALNRFPGCAPFTERDIDSALECLDERYVTFPRKDLERLTAVPMPPNKRNYRKRALHLRMARSNLEILSEDAGHALQGRPKGGGVKRDLIRSYAREHPDANHSEIARALGVSRPTVIKWLKDA